MARPAKSKCEKRTHEYKVTLNDFEKQKLIELAEGRSPAHVIRDLLSRSDRSLVVSPDNRETARQVRQINDLFNQLLAAHQRELEKIRKLEKQSELIGYDRVIVYREETRAAENDRWCRLNELLHALNIQLLGYADNHD